MARAKIYAPSGVGVFGGNGKNKNRLETGQALSGSCDNRGSLYLSQLGEEIGVDFAARSEINGSDIAGAVVSMTESELGVLR